VSTKKSSYGRSAVNLISLAENHQAYENIRPMTLRLYNDIMNTKSLRETVKNSHGNNAQEAQSGPVQRSHRAAELELERISLMVLPAAKN
jgi:hypothetical protein